MSILVTGGCGFIGSNFINSYFFKNPDETLINIDAMHYCANENNVDEKVRYSMRYHFIKGNLCSYDLILNILKIFNISKVVHFAEQSHAQNSFDNALQYTHDNVLGTHTLLEACRKYGKIKKFIHISTDEVYGKSMLDENEEKKYENSVLCPTNPYAATKAAAELIAKSYYHSFKMPIVITRGNNVYGPNQYPEKRIPLFIQQLKNNQKVTIQGDGSNVSAYLHVDDVCCAVNLILNKGNIGEIYNIGSDENSELSVLEVAKILISKIKNTNNYEEWIDYIEERPFNEKRYCVSNQKLKDLGWSVNVNFEDGINDLISIDNFSWKKKPCP